MKNIASQKIIIATHEKFPIKYIHTLHPFTFISQIPEKELICFTVKKSLTNNKGKCFSCEIDAFIAKE